MSEGVNRATLLGNLGADPELRFTQGGQAVLNLRLATTEVYFDKDKEKKERTDWHNVTVWGKRGEALDKILSKGSRVFIEGRIQTSSYDDKDGGKRYKTEIVATNVILAGDAKGGGARARRDEDEDDRPARRERDERPRRDDRDDRRRRDEPPRRAAAPRSDTNGRAEIGDDDIPY